MPPHRFTSEEARLIAARRRAARKMAEFADTRSDELARPIYRIAMGLALEDDPHLPRCAADVASEEA